MFSNGLAAAGAIAAIVAAVVVVCSSIIVLIKRCRRKHVLKNALEVHYLIPKNQYPEVSFDGAPNKEIKTGCLTVGIGRYRLMHVVIPRVDVLVDPIVLRFEGPEHNKPKRAGYDNPFIIKEITGPIERQYMDWWGDIHILPQEWPRYIYSRDTLVMGNRIETVGPWKGKVYFEIPLRGSPKIIKRLSFKVSEDISADQIPFLKGWSNDHKSEDKDIVKTEMESIDIQSDLEGIRESPEEEIPPFRNGPSGPL